jgi:hypothetical protein
MVSLFNKKLAAFTITTLTLSGHDVARFIAQKRTGSYRMQKEKKKSLRRVTFLFLKYQ